MTYLHTFGVVETDGFQPNGPPFQASDGNLYGTTRNGGANTCRPILPVPCGAIYRVSPSGGGSVLYQFGATPNDGYSAQSALIEGPDGALYGTTSNGGAHGGGGTIFRVALDGNYRTLYSFGGVAGEGDSPAGALVLGRDGNFYGLTSSGGPNHCTQIPRAGGNCGTVFRMSPGGTLTTLASFGGSAVSGVQPNAALVQAADGSFYGTTSIGGAHDRGTIFRVGTDGTLTTVYSFGTAGGDPIAPQGPLVQGTDGALYGTTPSGGGRGNGTVYRLSSAGQVTVVYSFGQPAEGTGPSPYLALGRDGHLYGTVRNGGANGGGTVFRLTYAGTITVLFSFGPNSNQPHDPEMGLIEGRDGAFYGTTFYNEGLGGVGARPGFGTLFKLTPR